MLVLHGSWVPAALPTPARFMLWAEDEARRGSGTRRKRETASGAASAAGPARHPFAATANRVAAVWDLPAGGGRRTGKTAGRSASTAPGLPCEVRATLPTVGGAPVASAAAGGTTNGHAAALAEWRLPALALDPVPAAQHLLSLAALDPSTGATLGDDVRYWIVATRFALELVHRQRLLPALDPEGEGYAARWHPLLDDARDRQRFDALAAAMPPACRALTWDRTGRQAATSGDRQPAPTATTSATATAPGPRRLLHDFLSATVDGVARAARPVGPRRPTRPPTNGRAPTEAWWDALFGAPLLESSPAVRELHAHLRTWARGSSAAEATDTFRLCFRLEPPQAEPESGPAVAAEDGIPPLHYVERPGARGAGGGGEVHTVKRGPRAAGSDGEVDHQPPWTLRYLLQATDDPSLLVPAGEVWRRQGATARFLNRRLDEPHERLLAGLGRAARLFPPVEGSLRAARPETCQLSVADAHRFVREAALVLRSSGFGVLVPGLESKLQLRIRLGATAVDPAKGQGKAAFTWDSLVSYDWQVALGDQMLTREEFEQLARLKEPLVQVRGQWVELDPALVERALAFFERRDGSGELELAEALKLALAPDALDDQAGLPIGKVEAEGAFRDLLRRLRSRPAQANGAARAAVHEPPGFTGQLRPYQKAGVAWLATLYRHGLGACLADDMGLGKTIQMIALILHAQHQRAAAGPPLKAPVLLVCPTSVVGNWQRELTRFAPSLRVLVHHGAGREKAEFAAEAARHDVVLSTYALLHRDEAELLEPEWGAVVLDEAQNVKNAATKAAQTARKLRTRWRAALSGTPVENRLSELWSILHFLNPGYLGSAEDFRKRFGNPIERTNDTGAASRLKALVAPFILRRVKTDRSIIQDLPEKNEMKVFCSLTREQATLYEAIVRDQMRQIEQAEGVQRRGQILATLTKLKQVCNHPALFLHDGSALPGRSGKLARLGEMLEEALAVDDRALIFTQYAEMGRLLKSHLESHFGQETLLLHGGTPAAERDRMVARFQREGRGPRLFVLSIKAGGTGLNLTNANHVFHFDRWWNPAVENQATDRAFRIGQRRDVQVHKFVCAGTFEETIDQLIERKLALSESIVGAGETWITEMSTAELRDLFALRHDPTGNLEAVAAG